MQYIRHWTMDFQLFFDFRKVIRLRKWGKCMYNKVMNKKSKYGRGYRQDIDRMYFA